ncbi:hypothetical protein [Actinomadura atramentaria]|uniref:hypothetical protein n=1 Tax=Actinomadura atramentaria TaxID=1990 RepID=UPI00037B3ABA|nr:hypothetical protein [Actinomadura atramentaria]
MIDEFRVEIDVPVPEGETERARVYRRWLQDGLDHLAGDLLDRLRAGPPLVKSGKYRVDGEPADGPPGSAWGALTMTDFTASGKRRESRRVWSPKNQDWFFDQLSDTTSRAQVYLTELNERGLPALRKVNFIAERPMYAPDWLVLTMTSNFGRPTDPSLLQEVANEMCSILGAWGDSVDTFRFGCVCTDIGSVLGQTPLEDALHINRDKNLSGDRTQLRGYSWVTLCPKEVVDRLGGAGRMTASGAFFSVEGLANGAVLARATENIDEYRGDAVGRVFRALAPALPAGLPSPSRTRGYLLAHEDADEYR